MADEDQSDEYWGASIRAGGKLKYFVDKSAHAYAGSVTAAVHWVNAQSALNYVPVKSEGEADVVIVVAGPKVSFEGNPKEPRDFTDWGLHGLTLSSAQRQDKMKIFLPAKPSINGPSGLRATGRKVKTFLVAHELLHAAGLNKHSDAALKDVLCEGLALDPNRGDTPDGDYVALQSQYWGGEFKADPRNKLSDLLPLLGNGTAQRLNAIWR